MKCSESKGRAAILGKWISAGCIALLLAGSFVGTGHAELPAPSWMPGFPLLAGGQVILMWSPVPGASKYKLYLDGKEVAEIPAFQHTMAAPEESGEHSYEVAALGADGKAGAKSRAGTIKIIVLSPPKNIQFRVMDGNAISMRWDKPEGALLFNVYRAEGKGAQFQQIASVQDIRYTETGLKPGVAYRYAVTAKDVSGKESNRSEEIQVLIAEAAASAKNEKEFIKRKTRVTEVLWEAKGVIVGLVGASDVEIDRAKGLLYVGSPGQSSVSVIDTRGNLVKIIGGKKGKGPGELGQIKGIGLVPDGSILYVADGVTGRVLSFDTVSGAFLSEFKVENSHTIRHKDEKHRDAMMKQPPSAVDVAVSPDGSELVVVDNPRGKLLVYTRQGKFLREITVDFHGKLQTPGFFAFPQNAKFVYQKDHSGDLIVADYFNHRFQIYDWKAQEWKAAFGDLGDSVGSFKGPSDSVVIQDGTILAADKSNQVIQGFSYDGKFLYLLGGKDANPIDIGNPSGLVVGEDGTLFVADGYKGRLIALRMTDKVLDQ